MALHSVLYNNIREVQLENFDLKVKAEKPIMQIHIYYGPLALNCHQHPTVKFILVKETLCNITSMKSNRNHHF